MKMTVIDPGNTGAFVTFDNGKMLSYMKTVTKIIGGSNVICVKSINEYIQTQKPDKVLIEKQSIRGGQGGGITIGSNYGRILAILELNNIDYETVHPSTWSSWLKKVTGDKRSGKQPKIEFALSQGYDIPPSGKKGKGKGYNDAIADCVCMYKWWLGKK